MFFFQAEDGIRDIGVTGVQTCALPICRQEGIRKRAAAFGLAAADNPYSEEGIAASIRIGTQKLGAEGADKLMFMVADQRSEERRVGKECRSRWSTYH